MTTGQPPLPGNAFGDHGPGDADLEDIPVEPLDPRILADVLDALADRQDQLDTAVRGILNRLSDPPTGGPWAWAELDSTQRRTLFRQVRRFVDWLVDRYQLRGEQHTIPPCWYRHPVAVEELTGLMVAWQAAYPANVTTPSDALVNWHDRWLWPTLSRLNTDLRTFAKCTGGAHTDPRPAPARTDGADFEDFLQQLEWPGTAQRPTGLDQATVRRLLADGDATALLPDDPLSPIRWNRTWYAIESARGNDDNRWTIVDDTRAARLDDQYHRFTSAGLSGPEPIRSGNDLGASA